MTGASPTHPHRRIRRSTDGARRQTGRHFTRAKPATKRINVAINQPIQQRTIGSFAQSLSTLVNRSRLKGISLINASMVAVGIFLIVALVSMLITYRIYHPPIPTVIDYSDQRRVRQNADEETDFQVIEGKIIMIKREKRNRD